MFLVVLAGCSSEKTTLVTTTCELSEGLESYVMVIQSREDGQIAEIQVEMIYNLELAEQSVVDELTSNPLTSEEIQERKEDKESFYGGLITYEVTEKSTEKEYTLTQTYSWNEQKDLDKTSPLETVEITVEGLEELGLSCK